MFLSHFPSFCVWCVFVVSRAGVFGVVYYSLTGLGGDDTGADTGRWYRGGWYQLERMSPLHFVLSQTQQDCIIFLQKILHSRPLPPPDTCQKKYVWLFSVKLGAHIYISLSHGVRWYQSFVLRFLPVTQKARDSPNSLPVFAILILQPTQLTLQPNILLLLMEWLGVD